MWPDPPGQRYQTAHGQVGWQSRFCIVEFGGRCFDFDTRDRGFRRLLRALPTSSHRTLTNYSESSTK